MKIEKLNISHGENFNETYEDVPTLNILGADVIQNKINDLIDAHNSRFGNEKKEPEIVKGCPFCGSLCSLERLNNYYTFRCENKECHMHYINIYATSEQKAINAWNTRQ
jgi:hypothetical protein